MMLLLQVSHLCNSVGRVMLEGPKSSLASVHVKWFISGVGIRCFFVTHNARLPNNTCKVYLRLSAAKRFIIFHFPVVNNVKVQCSF